MPRVGDHIVCLGPLPAYKGKNGEKEIQEFMARKMGRLVKFYKYGLNNVGWNKYSYIDIQFDNQIICRKRDAALHTSSTPAPPVANNEPAALSEGENTAAPAAADSQTDSGKKTDEKKEKADSNTRTNKAESNKTTKAESKKASKAEGKKTSDKESKNTSKKASKKASKKESKKQ